MRRIAFLQKPPQLVAWCAEMLAAGAASAPTADGEDAPAAPNFSSVLLGSKSSFCVRIRTVGLGLVTA